MLVNEKNIVFETGVQVGLQTKLAHHRVVVAVDVSIDTVHALEYLPNHAWEGLRKRDTWLHQQNNFSATTKCLNQPILLGNTASLSMLLWTQPIKCSMYVGAGIFVGLLKLSESCHKYSNLVLVSTI